ncbi:hypothetical protein FIV40_01460 [Pseudomonas marginalis]|nr:hypothetical protein FIV40_01460 [Pseudomonas marginalis]
MKSAHGGGPVVIGFMQVAAMVRGGAGAVQSGQGGLWAMIERKLPGAEARHWRVIVWAGRSGSRAPPANNAGRQ